MDYKAAVGFDTVVLRLCEAWKEEQWLCSNLATLKGSKCQDDLKYSVQEARDDSRCSAQEAQDDPQCNAQEARMSWVVVRGVEHV